MRLTTKMMCRLSALHSHLPNGRLRQAREFNRCSCASCSCCACKHYFCRFDMSSSASRQQCADANAVMWTNAAAAAVRAVSAQTLVSVGTFTNHAGARASACSARVAEKDSIRFAFSHAHTLQLDTAAPTHCCPYPVRRPSTTNTTNVQP